MVRNIAWVLVLVGCTSGSGEDPDSGAFDGGSDATTDVTTSDTNVTDSGSGASAPGSACDCNSECEGTSAHPGSCVQGICMMRSNGDCAEAGSSGECPAGLRCWGLDGVAGGICWPDCASFDCDGVCDSDGSCAPDDGSTCTASCSEICAEPLDIGPPPAGPPPASCTIEMGIPDWQCTSGCGELVAFDPRRTDGYWDYALNGETEGNQYRSFIRRDVMMLVRYATAMVACQAGDWPGNGGDLGLGDMSEADGAIPGTSVGSPGHPEGTHVDGHDMDIAYYQTGTPNNQLRPVCRHTTGGAEQYHCTGDPTMLDPWRTALFLGHVHANSNLRVIGVDGRVGPLVESALAQLCDGGWVNGAACARHSITWEETDMRRGWFAFHHHHLHISVSGS